MQRFACAALAAVAFTGGAAADDAPKAGELVFRPALDAVVPYVQRTRWHAEQRVEKKTLKWDGEIAQDFDLTVAGRSDDGTTRVNLALGRCHGWAEATNAPRVEFDTADAAPPADPLIGNPAFSPRRGTIALAVTRDGRVVAIDELVKAQDAAVKASRADLKAWQAPAAMWRATFAVREIGLLFPPLPGKPTPAGVLYDDEALPSGASAPLYRLRRRNELAAKSAEKALIRASGEVADLDPANAPSARKKDDDRRDGPTLRTSSFSSTAEIDRDDGLVLRANYHLAVTIASRFAVKDGLADGTTTHEWDIALERRPKPEAGK